MSFYARLALGLVSLAGSTQLPAQPTPTSIQPPAPSQDPQLLELIQEALRRNPDLARASALADAERERIPQAQALPDPSLTLGLQNDGFQKLQIGEMETSYYQVALTQPFLWPGKRGLRGEIASLGAEASRAQAARTRLSLVADVKRAYLGLLLVRSQKDLLDQQSLLWHKAGVIARTRYEVGQGSQTDLLRAQLEQNRLRQTRLGLQAEETSLLASLNRMRGTQPEQPIPTSAHLGEGPLPDLTYNWKAQAEQASPELQAARIGTRQAERSLALAQKDRFPDFAVTAGVMPRGSLDPMWQVGISISLPIWSRQKQQRAVTEQEIRRRAQGSEAESIRNLLYQRIQERSAQMAAAQETLQLFREGLLVQSEASFQAALAQYEAGRASFLSVLEALNGWIRDQGEWLQVQAQIQAIQIAQEEFNLSGTPTISAASLSAGAMGSRPDNSSKAAPSSRSNATSGNGEGAPAMKTM